jgi:5-methylcytosine-specific restriction endonuclease McrA
MEQHKINSIVDRIISNCRDEVEIKELLQCLSLVNWADAIAAKEYECSLRPCQICQEWKVCTTFLSVLDRNCAGFKFRRACPECVSGLPYIGSCAYCDTTYPSMLPQDFDFTCKNCSHISNQVKEQNMRAEKLGLLATLTVWQWREAIKHFNGQCAYGDHKYEVLEHYIPVVKGGGTTIDNCIPACNACNLKKGNRHPSKIDHLFPPDNLTRIREYLDQLSA